MCLILVRRGLINKAYVGKVYDELSKSRITLQRGMLFANVAAFREVLKDYVTQEDFEIMRIRNERTRIAAMCDGKGCKWYLHVSTKPDEVSSERTRITFVFSITCN